MTRRLFWKLCFIMATGTVTLFYIINILTSQTEEGMSYIDVEYRQQILVWAAEAERLYQSGNDAALERWLEELRTQEQTWVGVVEANLRQVAGKNADPSIFDGALIGRDVSWKIHLYFSYNPIMEVVFADKKTRFLIKLPNRMRPGFYLVYISLAMRIILPMTLLIPLTFVLYNHIMSPLRQLERATRSFSKGEFNVRVNREFGNRNDELTELANTFDLMASRTSELITRQRQLISDFSHELRTPLTRLDIAIDGLEKGRENEKGVQRVGRESKYIRKLVEDTLTLAWLDNEQRQLQEEHLETIELIDLLDVLCSDAQFEFPDRSLETDLPESALIHNSNHRAVGQALENVLRNALRYTPVGKRVTVDLVERETHYCVRICDQGPGVPEPFLKVIFQPFYRLEGSRDSNGGFGLGLALAKRQLETVNATIYAINSDLGGLMMEVELPK